MKALPMAGAQAKQAASQAKAGEKKVKNVARRSNTTTARAKKR